MFSIFKAPDEKKAEQDTRELPSIVDATIEQQRILKALHLIDQPEEFKLEELNSNKLNHIAATTNSAALHYSGNCAILATALLYNLKVGKCALTVGNIKPFYKPPLFPYGFEVILGTLLTRATINHQNNEKELRDCLLELYKKTKERFYLIDVRSRYIGHCFNAVILEKNNIPDVLFVDSWKTSKHIYTTEELAKRYGASYIYHIWETPKNIKPLKKPEVRKQISIDLK